MPINIGKNLKIEPTNDIKVSRFVRNYNEIHDYIDEEAKPTYYAYYTINGDYYSPDEDCCVIYSPEIWTNQGTSTTGSKDYEYSWEFMGISTDGTGFATGVLTISEFIDNGFKTSNNNTFFRVPGLDLYKDKKIRGKEVILYCYKVEDTYSHTIDYAFSPILIEETSTYYYHNLIMSSVHGPNYSTIVSNGYWCKQEELVYEDGVIKYGSDVIYTRCPEYDLYDLGSTVHSDNLILHDLLMSIVPKYTVGYKNLQVGQSLSWTCNNEWIDNNTKLPEHSIVEYTLTYSDGSRCTGSFEVTEDYVLDLTTLEANQYRITLTSDKTLYSAQIIRRVGTLNPYAYNVTSFNNNTYKFYVDKNESVSIKPRCLGYTYDEHTVDSNTHTYTYESVTSNLTCNATFPYTAWEQMVIYLKDENGSLITNITPYRNNITFSGDTSKYSYITDVSYAYVIWAEKNLSISWTINVPNYAIINNSGVVDGSTNYTENLVPMVEYTIVPTPNGSTVTLAASGYTTVSGTENQSITVAKGTTVTWSVVATDYVTQTGTKVVNSTTSDNVILVEEPKVRTFACGRYGYNDSYLTNKEYNISNNATVLSLRYGDDSYDAGSSVLCDNSQMKVYKNFDGTLLHTLSGTPKTDRIPYRTWGGVHDGTLYEEIQTTSNTVIELINGMSPRTLSIDSSKDLVGLIYQSGPYTRDNYISLVFKGNSNNLWERYVSQESGTLNFPTTGSWKTVNANITCMDIRNGSEYIGTSNGLATLNMYSTTAGASYDITTLASGYNVVDLISRTQNNVDTIHFITSDGKLYKYTSNNSSVTLVNDTYVWKKFIPTYMYFGAISTDGHIVYWQYGSSYVITTNGGYTCMSQVGQIKDNKVYDFATDNISSSYNLKYDVLSMKTGQSAGVAAIRYTTGS